MVNDTGQIYTIEGVAAAILMVVTAYLVLSTTTILTPQDVHIIDMQLQQMGTDALTMMDTPDSFGTESILAQTIRTNDTALFRDRFLMYANATAGLCPEDLAYTAIVYYREDLSNNTKSFTFDSMPYYRENAVKVSRWVYLRNSLDNMEYATHPDGPNLRDTNQTVLLEVLLWRV